MEKPLINKKFLLQKYPGKGGWTYALLTGVVNTKKKGFGWLKVKGTIDGYEIKKYGLMPVKGGGLFLPVRSEIRKHIKKQAGDHVHVILYPDTESLEIPDELLLCLKEEPAALSFFNRLSKSEQRLYILWITSAKKVETKVERIAKSINRLLKKQKLYDKD